VFAVTVDGRGNAAGVSTCILTVTVLIASPAAAVFMATKSTSASPWWAHDVAELGIDMF
jgi:hypothetical protein